MKKITVSSYEPAWIKIYEGTYRNFNNSNFIQENNKAVISSLN